MRLAAVLLLSLFARPALGACHRFSPATTDRRPPSVRLPQFIVCDLESELPTVDVRAGDLAFSKSSDKLWKRTASSGWSEVGAGGGGGVWGSITGTLSNQTDLQSALNGKANSPILDGDLPSSIARDTEITSAISTHEAASDPHTGYQRESEKGTVSGYASLDSSTLVPFAQLGTGTATGAKFLRDDRTWAVPPGGGGSANFLETSVTISGGAGFYSSVITGQVWVSAGSKIVCAPFGTTADGGTPELTAVAGFSVSVSDLVAGTGYTLNIWSPNGAEGTFRFHCSGS